MKKYGFIVFISIIISVMQQAVFSRLVLYNVSFDFIFIFLICFTLMNHEIESIFLAFLCGLIRDSFYPYIFGVNTIVYMLTVFLIIQINKRIYKNTIVIPVFLTLSLTIAKSLLYYAYFYISSIRLDFFEITLKVIIIESLLNSFICLFVYALVKKLCKLKIMQQEWKF